MGVLIGILNGYYGTKTMEIINERCDTSERILLVQMDIDDSLFGLNIYQANNELE